MKKTIISVPLASLQKKFFVRVKLDQDRVIALAELIEAGVRLDPIKITKDFVVIDGRHRIEAHELNSRIEIEAEIIEAKNDKEFIALAYKSNTGGSLPPSTEDTEHTIVLLLELGETHKRIADNLGLPLTVARKYINTIKSKLARTKLQAAKRAVVEEGMTAPKAAELHGVDLQVLKDALSGRKRKTREKENISGIKKRLSVNQRSTSQKLYHVLDDMLELFEDADVTKVDVLEVFDLIDKQLASVAKMVGDRRTRFEVKSKSGESGQ